MLSNCDLLHIFHISYFNGLFVWATLHGRECYKVSYEQGYRKDWKDYKLLCELRNSSCCNDADMQEAELRAVCSLDFIAFLILSV